MNEKTLQKIRNYFKTHPNTRHKVFIIKGDKVYVLEKKKHYLYLPGVRKIISKHGLNIVKASKSSITPDGVYFEVTKIPYSRTIISRKSEKDFFSALKEI